MRISCSYVNTANKGLVRFKTVKFDEIFQKITWKR